MKVGDWVWFDRTVSNIYGGEFLSDAPYKIKVQICERRGEVDFRVELDRKYISGESHMGGRRPWSVERRCLSPIKPLKNYQMKQVTVECDTKEEVFP